MTWTPLIDRILVPESLTVLLQPIMEVRGGRASLHGVECLVRGPKGTNLESAATLFEYVRRKRAEPLADRACIEAAFRTVSALPIVPMCTINVHASTLGRDADFPAFLGEAAARHAIELERVVVEIVEQMPYWNEPIFSKNLGALRDKGVKIALDDVGTGHSNLKMILEARPDILKLDGSIVRGSYADFYRWTLVEWGHGLAERLGARALAEGVEDAADYAAIVGAGIELLQGWYLFRPMSADSLVETGLLGSNGMVVLPGRSSEPACLVPNH